MNNIFAVCSCLFSEIAVCTTRIMKAALLLSFATLLLTAQVGASEIEGTYTGTIQPGTFETDIEVELVFAADGTVSWRMLSNEWTYYDDEDEFLYRFAPITGSGAYTYSTSTQEVSFFSEWSGEIAAKNDGSMQCEYFSVTGSGMAFTVHPQQGRTISGSITTGEYYCYEDWGCWLDNGTYPLILTDPTLPTETPTDTPTETQTNTPTPSQTPTWSLTPTATPTVGSPISGSEVLMQFGVGQVLSVAFSPDGKTVLFGGSGSSLWDVATGLFIRRFSGHTDSVTSVAFSPDGNQVLTGSWDKTAKLWDTETGAEIRTFSGHTGSVESVAFSPDGNQVLTGSRDETAKLWDVATGGEIRTFSGHTRSVDAVAFSPDGATVLTGGEDATAKLWDVATGGEIRTFSGHTYGVYSVAFSPDGTQVLTGGGYDLTAKLWDTETGAEIRTFLGHTDFVYSVAFSPDGMTVLTGSGDGTAKLWDVATGEEIRTFSGDTVFVDVVAFSPDGATVLTGSEDGMAKLWDVATGEEIRTFSRHLNGIFSVAFSPEGATVLTGGWDNTAKLWDTETGAEIRTFSGHTSYVYSVAFSPDGTQVLTGCLDKTAKLWDVATGGEIRTFSGHTSFVYSVAFSPDGTMVVTGAGDFFGSDSSAKLWDVATGVEIRTFSGHTHRVTSVAFSPNGMNVLTGSHDGTAKLWDEATGEEIRTFLGHTNEVNSVAFSPDGTEVLTGSRDETAKLWDTETGAEIRTFSGHTEPVNSVAFSPDGTQVLTGSEDYTVKFWDVATGGEIRTFSGHTNPVRSVAFSPDGAQVLTGSEDGIALLWSVPSDATPSPTATPSPNLPPTLEAVSIVPNPGIAGKPLEAVPAGFQDPEGADPSYRYEWFIDGVLAMVSDDSPILDPSYFVSGQVVSVLCSPFDGAQYGKPASDSVPIVEDAFRLSLVPEEIVVQVGQRKTAMFVVKPSAPRVMSVTFSIAAGDLSDITASFSPSVMALTPGRQAGLGELSLEVASGAEPTTRELVIQAASDAHIEQVTAVVHIRPEIVVYSLLTLDAVPTEPRFGEWLRISGALEPPIPDTPIKIVLDGGALGELNTQTDSNGKYRARIQVLQPNGFSVQALAMDFGVWSRALQITMQRSDQPQLFIATDATGDEKAGDWVNVFGQLGVVQFARLPEPVTLNVRQAGTGGRMKLGSALQETRLVPVSSEGIFSTTVEVLMDNGTIDLDAEWQGDTFNEPVQSNPVGLAVGTARKDSRAILGFFPRPEPATALAQHCLRTILGRGIPEEKVLTVNSPDAGIAELQDALESLTGADVALLCIVGKGTPAGIALGSGEILAPQTLGEMLRGIPGIVIAVIESDYAGVYSGALKYAADPSDRRVFITSCGDQQKAVFQSGGLISLLSLFLEGVDRSESVHFSLSSAEGQFQLMGPMVSQVPQMFSMNVDPAALIFGAATGDAQSDLLPPVILNVDAPELVNFMDITEIQAQILESSLVDGVTSTMTTGVTRYLTVEPMSLVDSATDVYSTASIVFDETGSYVFSILAADDSGNLSDPRGAMVTVVGHPIKGDLNGDGVVDHKDFLILSSCWMKRRLDTGYNNLADFNDDQVIDAHDLLMMLR